MKLFARCATALFFALTAVFSEVSIALAADAAPDLCLKIPANQEDRSKSVARFLITYVEPYWEIAKTTKPLRDSVSLEEDPSADGTKLEFHNVEFKTFQADFYRYTDGAVLPSSLSTLSARFKLPCGLKIGQSQKEVSEIVGAPTYVQSNFFIYATGGDQNAEVSLEFKRKKLWRVGWHYDTH
jgi:hypothetical protein